MKADDEPTAAARGLIITQGSTVLTFQQTKSPAVAGLSLS
jgi:hypothetical protein